MRRLLLVAVVAALLLGGLSACGKKGTLEPRPQSAIEAPGEARPA